MGGTYILLFDFGAEGEIETALDTLGVSGSA